MMRQTVTPPGQPDQNATPAWNVVLRSLRRAAGISQEGWAARLGYGRRTLQRWERGDTPPDAVASAELLQLCAALHLFRSYRDGALAGLHVSAEWLESLLADARLRGETASGAQESVALPRPAHDLPRELSSFVGRERERAELGPLLETVRLLTLTGPAGVGKTRLALKIAADRQSAFPHGVRWVDLSSLTEPSQLASVVASAVGAREQRDGTPFEKLIATLASRRLLLVLDNCEHLAAACAELAGQLLAGCPRLCLLATSRVPLRVIGEQVRQVPALSLPADADAISPRPEPAESVRLFLERARAVAPDVPLDVQAHAALARICRRLDGLPLAIELAAPWVRLLSPEEIAQRLDDRFQLLTSADRQRPARHQTLRAALDWSYTLLNPDDRGRFDRLSVFAGSFSLAAVAAICALPEPEALVLLARLVDASLVVADVSHVSRASRYRLLETLREYGRTRLVAADRDGESRQRLTAWLLGLAESAGGALHGPEQARWLGWVASEHPNLRAVLEWALERHDAQTALRLTDALWWAWGVLGLQGESRSWLERAAALPVSPELAPLRARVAASLASMALLRGDLDAARQHLVEAEALSEQTGAREALLRARLARTQLLQLSGEPHAAGRFAAETLQLARDTGDTWQVCRLLEMQAHAALRQGDTDRTVALLEEAARLARQAGDSWSLATALAELGDLARTRGAHADAGRYYRESLALRETLGIPGATPSLQHNLGYVALARADFGEAARSFAAALGRFRQLDDRRGMAECLIGLAGVLAAAGEAETAARLFGASDAALEALGAAIWPSNRSDYERCLACARGALDAAAFGAAWDAGRGLLLDDAVTVASHACARWLTAVPLRDQTSQPPTVL